MESYTRTSREIVEGVTYDTNIGEEILEDSPSQLKPQTYLESLRSEWIHSGILSKLFITGGAISGAVALSADLYVLSHIYHKSAPDEAMTTAVMATAIATLCFLGGVINKIRLEDGLN